MKHFQYLVLALTLLSGSAPVVAEIIKKTSSGICHPPQSTYYDRTQNFSAFHSVEACISSGGHLPSPNNWPPNTYRSRVWIMWIRMNDRDSVMAGMMLMATAKTVAPKR